ncbi:hypothetical protein ACH79_04960 [Bradyrhizobium sp. CCBAU 051011]|uniref:thermonuclease family protein n=1 Tax=Bradyrhizobium sp. CCBAU 051011 TaxID=858422 RepID=UPI0013744AA4|nr:thermonuclease family protein [Bradyrhizobium sp. CCBAU 051011]QHO72063.1 hypothetical protein ACH79_04960 [Bradyrhizobium sp. CCBAU 051011]
MAGPSLAAEIVVTNGDTFQLDRTIYRLDGIDAPEIDQMCLDQRGDVYKHRRIGICSIESEATTLNEWLVREGWAIKFDPTAEARFAAEEADARENRRGLWNGCFAEPRDLRGWNHMERDLSAAVVRPAMRTEHVTSYSASTPPCRQDARSS